ncbi:DUF4468 domain-containing protein [Chryseobacterium indologenes]|uniref:DUF4468 domain-containing protein n=1 Tax=Chryseobacterium indologenes TaxID=253 RepID=UPI001BCEA158|nr:DUF4468 domain-containing protein [Chryseobacterium indologenes]
MKKILFVLAIILGVLVFSQELKYEEVVHVDSTATKEELYNRARSWVRKTFNKKNSIIEVDNKASGEIIASGIVDYRKRKNYFGASCVEGPVRLTLSIYVKDGRYKYVFHSFDHKGSGGSGCRHTDYGIITLDDKAPKPSWGEPRDKAWNDIKAFISETVLLNVSDLKKAMNIQSDISKDW